MLLLLKARRKTDAVTLLLLGGGAVSVSHRLRYITKYFIHWLASVMQSSIDLGFLYLPPRLSADWRVCNETLQLVVTHSVFRCDLSSEWLPRGLAASGTGQVTIV